MISNGQGISKILRELISTIDLCLENTFTLYEKIIIGRCIALKQPWILRSFDSNQPYPLQKNISKAFLHRRYTGLAPGWRSWWKHRTVYSDGCLPSINNRFLECIADGGEQYTVHPYSPAHLHTPIYHLSAPNPLSKEELVNIASPMSIGIYCNALLPSGCSRLIRIPWQHSCTWKRKIGRHKIRDIINTGSGQS